MNAEKITVEYRVTRSQSYQSVTVGASVEVALAPGETPEVAFPEAMKRIAPIIEKEADLALRDVLRLTSNDH